MSRLAKLGAIVALVATGVAVGVLFGGQPVPQPSASGNPDGALLLARPAFAQAVQRTFLDEEAGISAYVKLDQKIDLAKVRPLFRVIEDEVEDEYIIGTITLAGYGQDWWPHVWITQDGWIVVYYGKGYPTSRLMHWPAYTGRAITSTTLREVLLVVAKALGAPDPRLSYYHWQFPEATRLFVVVGTGTFTYTLPAAFRVLEGSWSFRAINIGHMHEGWSELQVDGTRLLRGGRGTYTVTDRLAATFLEVGKPHNVVAVAHQWDAPPNAAVFFLYR